MDEKTEDEMVWADRIGWLILLIIICGLPGLFYFLILLHLN